MKTTHDSMKEKGVTDDHYKQARGHIAKYEPSYHAQVQQAIKELEKTQTPLEGVGTEFGPYRAVSTFV